jgi:hypothetical protein
VRSPNPTAWLPLNPENPHLRNTDRPGRKTDCLKYCRMRPGYLPGQLVCAADFKFVTYYKIATCNPIISLVAAGQNAGSEIGLNLATLLIRGNYQYDSHTICYRGIWIPFCGRSCCHLHRHGKVVLFLPSTCDLKKRQLGRNGARLAAEPERTAE